MDATGAFLKQMNEKVPDPIKWVSKSIGLNSEGEPVFMWGKVGPDWDFNNDPYAAIGDEVLIRGIVKGMVTEITETDVMGYLITSRKEWPDKDLNPTRPARYTISHGKYRCVLKGTKRFVSTKPRLEISDEGIKVWNNLCRVAVYNPEGFWGDVSSTQRSQEKKRCRSVSEGVARKPKQTARKTVCRKIMNQQNWGSMRRNKIQKTDHSTIEK